MPPHSRRLLGGDGGTARGRYGHSACGQSCSVVRRFRRDGAGAGVAAVWRRGDRAKARSAASSMSTRSRSTTAARSASPRSKCRRSPPTRRRAAPGRHCRHGRPRGPDRRQRWGAARCATARRCSPKARCSRRGFARVADRVGNRACAGELLRREDAAWQAKLGLWADPYYEVLAAAASTDVLARGEAGSRWRRAKWPPYAKAGPTYT